MCKQNADNEGNDKGYSNSFIASVVNDVHSF